MQNDSTASLSGSFSPFAFPFFSFGGCAGADRPARSSTATIPMSDRVFTARSPPFAPTGMTPDIVPTDPPTVNGGTGFVFRGGGRRWYNHGAGFCPFVQ